MTFQPAVRRMILATAIFLAIALTLFLTGPSGIGVTLAQANGQVGNSPATGLPTISGTVQVGETLTADTAGIADGLANVSYTYQWLADDSDISGATESTYTLAKADEGKTVKLRVTFTDDAGNEEALTSAATAAVAARPNSPAIGLPTITGIVMRGHWLTADTLRVAARGFL